jgi:hypothetical protein
MATGVRPVAGGGVVADGGGVVGRVGDGEAEVGAGEPGVGEVGVVGEPAQARPLTVQLVGRPVPLAVKPKLVEAPAAIVPFQAALANVYVLPDTDCVEFHELAIDVPAGKVSCTRQDVMVDEASLVTVTRPS